MNAGPGKNQERDADQENGCSDHGDDHTSDDLDIFNVPNADETFYP
jgi:hypothetical protein